MKLSKTSIIAAACLGTLALTGVGFAGWYIVSDANQTETGNITVYEIQNNTIVLEKGTWETGTNDGNVVFGHPKNATAKGSSGNSEFWFNFDDSVAEERLTPTLTMTMTAYGTSTTPKVEATLKLSKNDTSKTKNDLYKNYYNCIETDGYITGPALVTRTGSSDTDYQYSVETGVTTTAVAGGSTTTADNKLSVTITETASGTGSGTGDTATKKTYTVTIKLEFGWGNHFGTTSANPYTYYNDKSDGATTTNIEDATKAMSAIYGLNGLKYDLTIKATGNSGNA